MGSLNTDGKMIFMIFVGAIITVVMLGSIADSVFNTRNTNTQTNLTVTAPAVNGTLILPGRELVAGSTPIIRNATNEDMVALGMEVTDGFINGVQTVFLTMNDTASPSNLTAVNVTYDFNPQGYLKSQGDRSVVGLIIIMGSLAILITVIVILIKFGSLGALIRNR